MLLVYDVVLNPNVPNEYSKIHLVDTDKETDAVE